AQVKDTVPTGTAVVNTATLSGASLPLPVQLSSAVLVQTQHHALLVDTGPPMGASTAAERVLVPQLAALGVRGLDGLVITHADIDHSSGLETVWSTMRPGFLLTTMTGRTEQPQARCEAGQSWVWDGVWFRVVFPFADDPPPPHQRGRNEDSCVLEVIDMRGNRLLLTGDIPAEQERALLERAPWVGQGPTVLLMPHHGSKTSSSDALLGRLRPVLSVAQSAYRGRFAHPAPEVIERHARHGIAVARTDLMGGFRSTGRSRLALVGSGCERRLRRHAVSGTGHEGPSLASGRNPYWASQPPSTFQAAPRT
ncbi:MAG: ComEC/Rec2 family competence protein, partial [Burkholderiaceae bacterium]